MDFFEQTGKMALGSRLRLLTEKITEDAAGIYRLYGIDMQPKWFPVFFVLSKGEAKTITAIATEIGHSHPSVSKIIAEMSKAWYVLEKKDETDGRRNVVELSEKGQQVALQIGDQYADVNQALEELSAQTNHDLWQAIGEWEYLLTQKSLLRRVQDLKKQRESARIRIVDYQPRYQPAFRSLNEQWITQYFRMEAADYKALDHPQESILDKGGHILVALDGEAPVGVCALIKMDEPPYDYELAKMAVSPLAQGKGIGWLLGQAAIEKARSLGASWLYLESNTVLKPAIQLYQKLGFEKVKGHSSPYERCNIQMALAI